MKIRTEFSSTPAFDLKNKVGFSTDTVNDQAIKKSLGKLSALAAAGRLLLIPASATVEQVRTAVAVNVPLNAEEAKAAATQVAKIREEGNIPYHVVPCYMRVFEQGSGDGRTGTESAEFAGFGDVDSLIP